MAVGIILGGAFGLVVKSLVANVMMPIIGGLFKLPDFSQLHYAMDGLKYDTLELAQKAGDIHCGRYYLRVPSVEDLHAGKNIKILEFNGVTEEPAHVYQPGYPLFKGIADLCRQWKFAYEAGAQN
jgi:hypothetical protein